MAKATKPILMEITEGLSKVGVPIVRLLPGQKIDGEPSDVSLDILCGSNLVLDSPVGTILEVDYLVKKQVPGGGRYFYDTWEESINKKHLLRLHQK